MEAKVAVELAVKRKYLQHVNGHHKSSSNNQGANKHRGETDKVRKAAAMQATRDNQMVKVLWQGRKIRWFRASTWYAMDGQGESG
jgi:hypothetical protein